ncbi:hypothetical protein D3C76_1342650 [compost metagenome]
MFGKTFTPGQAFGVEDFVEFKGQVAGAEQGLGHGGIPFLECAESRLAGKGVASTIDEGDKTAKSGVFRDIVGGFIAGKPAPTGLCDPCRSGLARDAGDAVYQKDRITGFTINRSSSSSHCHPPQQC